MGLLRENPLVQLEGKVGNLVFAKHKPGIKVVRKPPVRTAPPTEAELANQNKFKLAVQYANAVWADNPELKAKYNAVARPQFRRGYNLAKSDFRRPPAVEDIELAGYTGKSGERIRIRAIDDFEVVSVTVLIRDLAGAVLEEGAALLENDLWVYTAKKDVAAGQTVVVEVIARDNPGHPAIKKLDHACGPRS